jgi:hypothetical protein
MWIIYAQQREVFLQTLSLTYLIDFTMQVLFG